MQIIFSEQPQPCSGPGGGCEPEHGDLRRVALCSDCRDDAFVNFVLDYFLCPSGEKMTDGNNARIVIIRKLFTFHGPCFLIG